MNEERRQFLEYFKGREERRRQEVIHYLECRLFCHDPHQFYASLIQSHHPKMLTPYTVSELCAMSVYKVLGYNVGFALKDHEGYREIVAVHNNELKLHFLGRHIIA